MMDNGWHILIPCTFVQRHGKFSDFDSHFEYYSHDHAWLSTKKYSFLSVDILISHITHLAWHSIIIFGIRNSKAQNWLSCMAVECGNSLIFQRIYPNTYRTIHRAKRRRHSILNFRNSSHGLRILCIAVYAIRHTPSTNILYYDFLVFFRNFFSLLAVQCIYLIFILHFNTCHPWQTWLQFLHTFHNGDNNLVYHFLFAFTSFHTLVNLISSFSVRKRFRYWSGILSLSICHHSDGTKRYYAFYVVLPIFKKSWPSLFDYYYDIRMLIILA